MTFEMTRIKQRLADLESNQRSLLKITDGLLKQMETTQQAILELDEIVKKILVKTTPDLYQYSTHCPNT